MDVVETAADLAPRMPKVLFLWAGDGPGREGVERAIERRGLGANFSLLGWREDVGRLLAASDALLLTSIYEGLPRVVLQAMAAGKPVVATAVSGTPEAVKAGVTGFLHAPHDTDGLAESLHQVLSNPSRAKAMGAAGRRALRGTFLIAQMLKEIEKIYDKPSRR
jgi:glycosyltransferase involved in cell wall biosynthesis